MVDHIGYVIKHMVQCSYWQYGDLTMVHVVSEVVEFHN